MKNNNLSSYVSQKIFNRFLPAKFRMKNYIVNFFLCEKINKNKLKEKKMR